MEQRIEKVILAMPRYHSMAHMDAALTFANCSREGYPLTIRHVSVATSALTCTFNSMWAIALDAYEAGECDYFAMQHDDVCPPMYWLDQMHMDLLACGADVLSAVIPIKDHRGRTSTAVDDTGDEYRPRRLQLSQVAALPEIFTDADVGGELLLNTGLWICRMGPWAAEIVFTVYNEIRKNPATGRRAARFIPEDWDFSRQCRKLGLKLAATRKLGIGHMGAMCFRSDQVWGEDHDSENAPRKVEVQHEPGDPIAHVLSR